MQRARAILSAAIALALAGCGGAGGSEAPSPDVVDAAPRDTPDDPRSDAAEVDGATPELALDGAGGDPAESDAPPPPEGQDSAEPTPDLPFEELPPDVEIPLSVELYLDSATCDTTTPGVGLYRLALHWKTSIAAISRIELALNDLAAELVVVPIDEPAAVDHAYDLAFTAFHFARVPKAGDVILVRVHAEAPAGQVGQSEPLAVAVNAAVRACLYPYDPECSDNAPVICRLPPPTCTEPRVLAAFEGCYHCVYTATCTCDDGDEAVCPNAPPTCSEGQLLAVQGGCFACVDPRTCEATP